MTTRTWWSSYAAKKPSFYWDVAAVWIFIFLFLAAEVGTVAYWIYRAVCALAVFGHRLEELL